MRMRPGLMTAVLSVVLAAPAVAERSAAVYGAPAAACPHIQSVRNFWARRWLRERCGWSFVPPYPVIALGVRFV